MKKENKSLFLYTSLIFLVSIMMILISFVGQNNIKTMQPETDSSGTSIVDKVNQLSEQNSTLINEKAALIKENEELTTEKETNSKIIKTMTDENLLLNKFLQIYNYFEEGKLDDAKLIYDSIDASLLTETQRIYYDKFTLKFQQ